MTPSSAPPITRRSSPTQRRTAALDAFIDLVLEHGGHPRPEDVAALAGVSIASLYRYFESLEELRRDAVARLVERFPELFAIPRLGTGPRTARIDTFVDTRFALHEELHTLQLLYRAASRSDEDAVVIVDTARAFFADQVRSQFARELASLGPAERDDTVAAIAALTSVESWEQFRRSHARSPRQTRRAWARSIDRLLPEETI